MAENLSDSIVQSTSIATEGNPSYTTHITTEDNPAYITHGGTAEDLTYATPSDPLPTIILKRECETVVYNLTLLHACHCVNLLCDVTLFLLIFKFVHVAMHSLVYCAWNNNYVDETQHYWQ